MGVLVDREADHRARPSVPAIQKGHMMPIIHVSLRAGKPKAYRQAILDGLYRAMRDTLAVPEDEPDVATDVGRAQVASVMRTNHRRILAGLCSGYGRGPPLMAPAPIRRTVEV